MCCDEKGCCKRHEHVDDLKRDAPAGDSAQSVDGYVVAVCSSCASDMCRSTLSHNAGLRLPTTARRSALHATDARWLRIWWLCRGMRSVTDAASVVRQLGGSHDHYSRHCIAVPAVACHRHQAIPVMHSYSLATRPRLRVLGADLSRRSAQILWGHMLC